MPAWKHKRALSWFNWQQNCHALGCTSVRSVHSGALARCTKQTKRFCFDLVFGGALTLQCFTFSLWHDIIWRDCLCNQVNIIYVRTRFYKSNLKWTIYPKLLETLAGFQSCNFANLACTVIHIKCFRALSSTGELVCDLWVSPKMITPTPCVNTSVCVRVCFW